ncbi:hypothetical protein [Streptosporangium sp. NPDC023615]|uniref:hypothetical protein n=1 Tax=Streptosporangium sp. NPDC023615 TaxID=3154794 RepID=UPI0034475422
MPEDAFPSAAPVSGDVRSPGDGFPSRDPSTPGADTAGADTPGADTPGADTAGADTAGAAREALAGAQTVLVAALVAGGRAPSGFDRERLRVQEASLIAKRRRTVARLRPDLVTALGDAFAAEFHAYARGRPKPPGGSHADAHDFAARLRAAGRLPEPVVREPVAREPVVRGPAAGSRLWSILTRRGGGS